MTKVNYPTLQTSKIRGKNDPLHGVMGHKLYHTAHKWPIWKTAVATLEKKNVKYSIKYENVAKDNLRFLK
jgi:hypothetical protein